MRKLRPTLIDSLPGDPSLTYDQTFLRVLESVKIRRSLIHGRLRDNWGTCAIGAYFNDSTIALPSKAIDEIAAYNDSFPLLTPHQRWKKVLAWLKIRVASGR